MKAGNDKHNLFVYDPESTGDTDLGPQAGNGNGISHISFCYDDEDVPGEPPGDEPTRPRTSAARRRADAARRRARRPRTSRTRPTTRHPSPSGEVQGVTGTPKPTLPPTDALASGAGSTGSAVPALLVILSLVTITGIVTVRMPSRSRR